MKRAAFAILVLFSPISLSAQQAPVVPATRVVAELKQKIDSRSAKVADQVRFRTLRRERIGTTVIPKGATLTGRIVEVSPLRGQAEPSRLAIAIDRADWKGGSLPLHLFIIAQGERTYTFQYVRTTDPEYRYLGMDAQGLHAEGLYDPTNVARSTPPYDYSAKGGSSPITKNLKMSDDGPEGTTVLLRSDQSIVIKKGTLLVLGDKQPK